MSGQPCGVKPGDCPNLHKQQKDIRSLSRSPEEGSKVYKGKCPFLRSIEETDLFPMECIGFDNGMICIKPIQFSLTGAESDQHVHSTDLGKKEKKSDKKNEGIDLKESKSRELRAGILYAGCDCEKRNGLQDQCPRSQCQGSPQCLTIPPTCPPSQFSNGKHLMKKMQPKRHRRPRLGF